MVGNARLWEIAEEIFGIRADVIAEQGSSETAHLYASEWEFFEYLHETGSLFADEVDFDALAIADDMLAGKVSA